MTTRFLKPNGRRLCRGEMKPYREGSLLEPSVAEVADKPLESRFQLQRLGYFTVDRDSTAAAPVLNRIVTLKESKELKALNKA